MIIFSHPLWPSLRPYAVLSAGGRDNLDLLQLPDDLREKAAAVVLPCIACGEPTRVFRARMKSGRSRVAGQVEERRMFYAATCPSAMNSGCSRSLAAKSHKKYVRDLLGKQREPVPSIKVQFLDPSGDVLAVVEWPGKELCKMDLPRGAVAIAFVPAR